MLTVMGVVKSPTKHGIMGIQGITWAFDVCFIFKYEDINPTVTFGLILARKLLSTKHLGAICDFGVVKGLKFKMLGSGVTLVTHCYTKGDGLSFEIVGNFCLHTLSSLQLMLKEVKTPPMSLYWRN
uniref:Uncharacterized protein n=1 Tax=Lactuca sativa TaxID=4236 RepID=A0A9R1UVI1_LACSA|nr:hypothetical protein LSAT_V11C800441960 [Lactuca sativa]